MAMNSELNPRILEAALVPMGIGVGAYILGSPLYWILISPKTWRKNFTDLLSEEVNLRETHAAMNVQRQADVTLVEAKQLASQYQKEADKCILEMGTCEEAGERAEAALKRTKETDFSVGGEGKTALKVLCQISW